MTALLALIGRGEGRQTDHLFMAIVPAGRHVLVANLYRTARGEAFGDGWRTLEDSLKPPPSATPAPAGASLLELLDA